MSSVLLAVVAACVSLLCLASSASAAVVLGVGPNIPSPNRAVTVGETAVPSSLTITNISDQAQGPLNVTVDPNSITLVPSCGTIPATPDCPAASVDPGVFAVSATGTGAVGTACANTVFTITKVDATQDKYVLSPSTAVMLGPGDTGGQLARCTINFTVDVLKVPTKDARADPGIQTDELAGVTATASDNQTGSGFGSNFTTVNRATAAIATAVAPTPIALGAQFHDTATITGNGTTAPTGTVVFTVFGPNDTTCVGPVAFTSTNAVSTTGGVTTATSSSFTPTQAGTYRVVAQYSGDAIYAPVTTACGDAGETETVSPGTPTVATAVAPTPIALGGAFHDTATLTGSGVPPTGTVDFTVFGPNDATCAGTAAFTSTGNAVSTTAGVTTATMPNFTPTLAGTYRVVAHYSGDANYTALTTACGAAGETETITPATPSVTTAVAPTPIALGGAFHDTATLTGTGAVAPTGTVDFTVFGPNDGTCAGTAAFTSTGNAVSTTGGVTTATMPSFTPTKAGTYNVVAHYSGDANYTALTTACGAAGETETITPGTPTVTTVVSPNPVALGGAFHDTATLTGSGVAPTGTVDFTVFGPNDGTCAGAAAFTSTGNPVSTTGGVTTATMANFTPTLAGSYNVVAHYSGDANYTA
ncbi:MAG: hypothetical protein QOI16_4481, partial [Pseudonocardiales bacterium]|nr:hypothetical protein [Pseudonocardiales bacterium]